MQPATKPKSGKGGRGGARPGSGRKGQWAAGTVLKSMRLPESLEDELRQYAHQRLAEMEQGQAKAAERKAAGPPPEMRQVRMEKIDARHYRMVHQERTIGHVSRMSDGRWGAWLSVPEDEEPFYVNGPTRRRAVSDLLEAERARWHRDAEGELSRDNGEA